MGRSPMTMRDTRPRWSHPTAGWRLPSNASGFGAVERVRTTLVLAQVTGGSHVAVMCGRHHPRGPASAERPRGLQARRSVASGAIGARTCVARSGLRGGRRSVGIDNGRCQREDERPRDTDSESCAHLGPSWSRSVNFSLSASAPPKRNFAIRSPAGMNGLPCIFRRRANQRPFSGRVLWPSRQPKAQLLIATTQPRGSRTGAPQLARRPGLQDGAAKGYTARRHRRRCPPLGMESDERVLKCFANTVAAACGARLFSETRSHARELRCPEPVLQSVCRVERSV
jgi:hypothetical protein